MKLTFVKCPHCLGSGKTALSDALQTTLDLIPRDRFMSTDEIHAAHKDQFLKRLAVHNRIAVQLADLRLVTSERRGRTIFWKRIK